MEMLQQFGVNPILLIAQIINFLIVFYILKKLLYKPVLETLKKREKTIQDGIKQAEEARIMYDKAAEHEKELLKKAHNEAKAIVTEAKEQSAKQLADSEEKTRQQVEKMILEAKAQIAEDAEKTKKQLQASVTHLAVGILEKALSDVFTPKEQEEVMKKVSSKIKVSN